MTPPLENYRRIIAEPGRQYISLSVERCAELLDYAESLAAEVARLERKAELYAPYVIHWPACQVRQDRMAECTCGLADAARAALDMKETERG